MGKPLTTITMVLLLLLGIQQGILAQGDISEYTDTNGEIVFVTGSIDSSISNYTPSVTIDLAGAVFNENGYWMRECTVACNEKDYYGASNDHNTLFGYSIDMSTIEDEEICWESVYDGDSYADNSICPGMVGWGDYMVTVEMDGSSFSFYFSTLDGNWMTEALGDTNQFVFHVSFSDAVGTPSSPIAFDVSVYNWSSGTWDTVNQGDHIKWWELTGYDRNREQIGVMYNAFKVNSNSYYDTTMHLPISVSSATVDIDLIIEGNIVVDDNKTLHFSDFYEPTSSSYEHTTVYFDSTHRIDINGGMLSSGSLIK